MTGKKKSKERPIDKRPSKKLKLDDVKSGSNRHFGFSPRKNGSYVGSSNVNHQRFSGNHGSSNTGNHGSSNAGNHHQQFSNTGNNGSSNAGNHHQQFSAGNDGNGNAGSRHQRFSAGNHGSSNAGNHHQQFSNTGNNGSSNAGNHHQQFSAGNDGNGNAGSHHQRFSAGNDGSSQGSFVEIAYTPWSCRLCSQKCGCLTVAKDYTCDGVCLSCYGACGCNPWEQRGFHRDDITRTSVLFSEGEWYSLGADVYSEYRLRDTKYNRDKLKDENSRIRKKSCWIPYSSVGKRYIPKFVESKEWRENKQARSDPRVGCDVWVDFVKDFRKREGEPPLVGSTYRTVDAVWWTALGLDGISRFHVRTLQKRDDKKSKMIEDDRNQEIIQERGFLKKKAKVLDSWRRSYVLGAAIKISNEVRKEFDKGSEKRNITDDRRLIRATGCITKGVLYGKRMESQKKIMEVNVSDNLQEDWFHQDDIEILLYQHKGSMNGTRPVLYMNTVNRENPEMSSCRPIQNELHLFPQTKYLLKNLTNKGISDSMVSSTSKISQEVVIMIQCMLQASTSDRVFMSEEEFYKENRSFYTLRRGAAQDFKENKIVEKPTWYRLMTWSGAGTHPMEFEYTDMSHKEISLVPKFHHKRLNSLFPDEFPMDMKKFFKLWKKNRKKK